MVISGFKFAKIPKIIFGQGKFNELASIIRTYGTKVLIIRGGLSLEASGKWDILVKGLKDESLEFSDFLIKGEPSPELVDRAAAESKGKDVDVVVAIGGGSVVDAGKAISAMLPYEDSVVEYLEGVGTKTHDGRKVPFIAVPTTSGTGSEATKNAVLSRVGVEGFKKSLRHDNLVPDAALLDPELTLSCPPHLTAACGMDAFCQLLESYVSKNASPMTDALALSGLRYTKGNLILAAQEQGAEDVNVRSAMAYASLMSGITLANAGLGVVHGLASPIGGYFNIPHGVVCGTLVGAATNITIEKLQKLNEPDNQGLMKYADVGCLLTDCDRKDYKQCLNRLIEKLYEWSETLKLPRLGDYGITQAHIDKIIKGAGNKQNPVKLDENEIKDLLLMRL